MHFYVVVPGCNQNHSNYMRGACPGSTSGLRIRLLGNNLVQYFNHTWHLSGSKPITGPYRTATIQ